MDDHTAMRPAADLASALPMRAEVLHDGRIGPDDEELILAALTGCGVAAEVKIIPARAGRADPHLAPAYLPAAARLLVHEADTTHGPP